MLVVLGAGFLFERLLYAPKTPDCLPGLVVGIWIIDGHGDFEVLAFIDQLPALCDVQLLGVRRAVIVDKALGGESDGVYHERIALVMPDRFSVPGRFRIRRMRHVEMDAPHLMVALRDDHAFLG